MVQWVEFESFGRAEHGRVITEGCGWLVVQARNPYGSHNLVLVKDEPMGQAIRHGTVATLEAVANWMPERAYRRVRKHLAARGVGLDWWRGE